MNYKYLKPVLYLSMFFLLGLLFNRQPNIDLYISSLFFKDGHFFLKDSIFVEWPRRLVYVIVVACCIAFVVYFIKILKDKRSLNPCYYIKLIYLISVCALGPGLVINFGFKDQFNRARPYMIKEFGGDKDFTPAFHISNQCDYNCSFVSGHASVGFMFYALAFICCNKKRREWFVTATLMGLAFGGIRIIAGGHFLSDIIFSGIVTFIIAYLLQLLAFRTKK